MNDSQATAPRHPKLKAALRQARSGGTVPSPCVGVCRMDAASGYCLGCWRTLDEIARWGAASAAEQLVCWQRIGQRLMEAGSDPATSPAPPQLG
jgi:predicted Fe-S protein YdhL (DUF1289 family)